jgi:hypothetical protein
MAYPPLTNDFYSDLAWSKRLRLHPDSQSKIEAVRQQVIPLIHRAGKEKVHGNLSFPIIYYAVFPFGLTLRYYLRDVDNQAVIVEII